MRLMKGISVLRRKEVNKLPYEMAVGQITKLLDANTREVKVLQMEMNDYLKMYFNKSYLVKTVDESAASQKGDIVLVRKLTKTTSLDKEYGVEKVLFKIGEIVDPITGKKESHDEQQIQMHLESLIKAFNK
jgi:hypothetical protein